MTDKEISEFRGYYDSLWGRPFEPDLVKDVFRYLYGYLEAQQLEKVDKMRLGKTSILVNREGLNYGSAM
jgi:hypothetical protein